MKISNPVALMRGMLDIFLAQPFGQKSLAQRLDYNDNILFILLNERICFI